MGRYWGIGLGLVFFFSGCGIQSTAEQTRDEVIKSNVTQGRLLDGINKTNNAVHRFALATALHNLFDPLNTVVLFPPTRMMPFAEDFAKEATEEEITKLSYDLIQDASQGSTATTPEEQAKDEMDRRARLTGMGLIAAFIPDDKWAKILKTQVDGKGRFESTVYSMAAARFGFIRDFLYNPLIDLGRPNQGSLNDTAEWFGRMKSIATASYVSSIVLDIPNLAEHDEVSLADLKRLADQGINKVMSLPDFAKSTEGQRVLKVFDLN
jgi:hypothetical protein